MSLFVRLVKPALVRRSSVIRLVSNGFSTSLKQTAPCHIFHIDPCGDNIGNLVVSYDNEEKHSVLEKKVRQDLQWGTVGSSNGWVATLNDDGVMSLGDDLNPVASESDPKRIPLPPFVTLPHCQTQIITNIAMSSSSPEDDLCVVAVKFLGPQLSFYGLNSSEWFNVKIDNPCFYSSQVMFSKKDEIFSIPGSGGHLIGSWDSWSEKPKAMFHELRFRNIPKLSKSKREMMDSCMTSQHLVASSSGETFLVKSYKKTHRIVVEGISKAKTKAVMVFKLDEEGNAVYTEDIGDLCIFISKAEAFCVSVSSHNTNCVQLLDYGELCHFYLDNSDIFSRPLPYPIPYHIPPQNITNV